MQLVISGWFNFRGLTKTHKNREIKYTANISMITVFVLQQQSVGLHQAHGIFSKLNDTGIVTNPITKHCSVYTYFTNNR